MKPKVELPQPVSSRPSEAANRPTPSRSFQKALEDQREAEASLSEQEKKDLGKLRATIMMTQMNFSSLSHALIARLPKVERE